MSAWASEAQVRAHHWLLSSAGPPDGPDYVVPAGIITDRETAAETLVTARLRRHYDTTAAAFQADATIVYITGRLAAALCVEYMAQGTEHPSAQEMRDEAEALLDRVESGAMDLSVSRRTDIAGDDGAASSCSTADTTPMFDRTQPGMAAF